ncbi:MAG: tol-pal system protein YbgF [Hyphomicrobiaceae bacterium]|nr:tol-pal system protein YbgF [Hyphomicrobiaceae bacterium]
MASRSDGWSAARSLRCGAFIAGLGALVAAAIPAAHADPLQLAQATPPPSASGGAKAKPRAAETSQDAAGLSRRVEQLEEQLVDLQVTIGTLESIARSGGGGGGAGRGGNGGGFSGSASDAARIEGMETQLRALSAEVQRLTNQVRQLGGSPGTGREMDRGDAGGGDRRLAADSDASRTAPRINETIASTGFGSTTVRGAEGDPIGTLLQGAPSAGAPAPGYSGRETEVAALPAAGGGSPKQDYETAYGYLLKQDYGAAEAAFEDFLQRYPTDPLAGNAQYWLGETHFVRGSYKPAAAAFLKGYQNFAKGNKAPDSLLKLAMSLDRLGQKDAACSSFRELTVKFPSAPVHVKGRADTEMKRLGCS